MIFVYGTDVHMQCLEPRLQPLPELPEYENGAYSGFISLPKHPAYVKVHAGASLIAGTYPEATGA